MTVEEKMESFEKINALVELLMNVLRNSNEGIDVDYLAVLTLHENMKTALLSMGINPDEI